MKRSVGWIVCSVVLAGTALATTQGKRVILEATVSVPVEHDSCLDHSVRELGMSAKRVEKQRRWHIGPQFLHPTVKEGGAVELEVKMGTTESVVVVRASWLGGAKEEKTQVEIESRFQAIAAKMAQMCGVIAPTVKCTRVIDGEPSQRCSS